MGSSKASEDGNAALASALLEAGCSHAALARKVNELGRVQGLVSRDHKASVTRWLSGMVVHHPSLAWFPVSLLATEAARQVEECGRRRQDCCGALAHLRQPAPTPRRRLNCGLAVKTKHRPISSGRSGVATSRSILSAWSGSRPSSIAWRAVTPRDSAASRKAITSATSCGSTCSRPGSSSEWLEGRRVLFACGPTLAPDELRPGLTAFTGTPPGRVRARDATW